MQMTLWCSGVCLVFFYVVVGIFKLLFPCVAHKYTYNRL